MVDIGMELLGYRMDIPSRSGFSNDLATAIEVGEIQPRPQPRRALTFLGRGDFSCSFYFAGHTCAPVDLAALNILDDFNREGLGIEVDISLPALRVVRALERIIEWRGKPMSIRVDNGPGNVSAAHQIWAQKRGIGLSYIQPRLRIASHCLPGKGENPNKTPMSSATTGRFARSG